MKNFLIISGKKETGKNEFSKFFENKNYVQMALAQQLKEDAYMILRDIYRVPHARLNLWDGNKKIEIGVTKKNGEETTCRSFMQDYGQIMKEVYGELYWVDILIQNIRAYNVEKNTDSNFTMTDARFPFEIEQLKKEFSPTFNTYTIRMKRDTGNEDGHASEIGLDCIPDSYFDFVIDNNYDLIDLGNKCRGVYDTITTPDF